MKKLEEEDPDYTSYTSYDPQQSGASSAAAAGDYSTASIGSGRTPPHDYSQIDSASNSSSLPSSFYAVIHPPHGSSAVCESAVPPVKLEAVIFILSAHCIIVELAHRLTH